MNGCPYCTTDGERKPIPGWGGGELEMVQITPMPAINLTTGERDTSAETPFWAMNFTAFENELEEFIPINNCPMCGRKLPERALPSGETHGHKMIHCNSCLSTVPASKIPHDVQSGADYCPICMESGCLIEVEV